MLTIESLKALLATQKLIWFVIPIPASNVNAPKAKAFLNSNEEFLIISGSLTLYCLQPDGKSKILLGI